MENTQMSKKEYDEFRSDLIFRNYLANNSGRILTGPEKRALKRKIARDVAAGKYDKMFDDVSAPKSTAAGRNAFAKLNGQS